MDVLQLTAPAFSRTPAFRQLEYVETYVRNLGCQGLLLEGHYVDRDYIEDHSLFYSRSFFDYRNACRRLHFFRVPPEQVKSKLTELEGLFSADSSGEQVALQSRQFSRDQYIGFVVIKPLSGSPVGRTILRCFGSTTETDARREYPAVRRYPVHLGAVELEVVGLPFQQQDVGVSACATTALWSALHRVRDFEEIGSPTPAQITTLATQYSLPFGRPMPSDEGLSLDQMCQALHALRVAPSLLHVDSFYETRAYAYSALRSGFAPVLVLQSRTDENIWHAVTVVGYRSAGKRTPAPGEAYDRSGDVTAFYVHDDRVGPYQRVNPIDEGGALMLDPEYASGDGRWVVRYVLVPLHAKIRISVSSLLEVAVQTLDHLRTRYGAEEAARNLAVSFENWISRPMSYLRALFRDTANAGPELARALIAKVAMPRYVGVVRIEGVSLGTIDVLVDTTSTMKNLNFLAVAHHGGATDARTLEALANAYACPLVRATS